MKVLMVNTPASVKFRGGDTTQMHKTAEALQPLGVEVTIRCDEEPEAAGFDLAHVFNLRTIDATAKQVAALKRFGIPVVLSPIYLNTSTALWGSKALQNVFQAPPKPPDEDLAYMLRQVKARKLNVAQPGGRVFTAESQNRTQPNYDDRQRAILADVDHLLPNSLLEMDALVKTLRVYDIPFTVVPYGCDPKLFLDPDPTPFVEKHGLKDFVLQVGRIEASKNQLMLAYAMRNLDLPLVFIGGHLQPEYLGLCQLYGPKSLKVIPHLPTEELRHAYAAARVHVLPSWIETCGLVTLEAALANCNVVASIAGHELEYLRELAYYCDPADEASIRSAVVEAYEHYDQDAVQRGLLKERIRKEYTWERAAERTLAAYRRVMEEPCSKS